MIILLYIKNSLFFLRSHRGNFGVDLKSSSSFIAISCMLFSNNVAVWKMQFDKEIFCYMWELWEKETRTDNKHE